MSRLSLNSRSGSLNVISPRGCLYENGCLHRNFQDHPIEDQNLNLILGMKNGYFFSFFLLISINFGDVYCVVPAAIPCAS